MEGGGGVPFGAPLIENKRIVDNSNCDGQWVFSEKFDC